MPDIRGDARWGPLTRAPVIFLFAAGAALSVYGLTLQPDLTWLHYSRDGAELITAAMTLGVPHPPGYPTYVLIGNLFGTLPVVPIPVRFHIMSAVAVSLAAAVIALTAYRWLLAQTPDGRNESRRSALAAVAAGLTFAFSPLVWGQATVAEVYGLNLLFVALSLAASVRSHSARKKSARGAMISGLLLGLALTTHLTSLLLLPLALRLHHRRRWPGLALGMVVGLLPLAALPWLGAGDSPMVWGSTRTIDGWWWLVSGTLYRPNIGHAPVVQRLAPWAVGLLAQWAFIGWLALVPAVKSRDQRVVMTVAVTSLAYLVYALAYDADDAFVLSAPALALLSLLLAFGLRRMHWFGLALPLLLVGLNFGALAERQAPTPRELGVAALEAAPRDAIVLTSGDVTTFTLAYLQSIEGHRPDLALIDRDLFAFSWYRQRVAKRYPALEVPEADDLSQLARRPSGVRCRADLLAAKILNCAP